MVVLTAAGDLRHRVAFEQSVQADDGGGLATAGFVAQFETAAGIAYLKATEGVVAERLQGVQPAVITVRDEGRTRQVAAGWRARDVRTGLVYRVTATSLDRRSRYIDLMCEAPS